MLPGLSRPLAPVAGLVFGALGAFALATVVTRAPAFNETLQVEGAGGGTRVPDLTAMYDHGAYLMQTGFGYLRADLTFLDNLDEETLAALGQSLETDGAEDGAAPAGIEAATRRHALARQNLENSLRLDPGNAYAWLALAESLAALGETQAAGEALVTSWRLAPTMAEIALPRVVLIEGLRELTGEAEAFGEIHASDVATLALHEPDLSQDLPTP